MSQDDSRTYPAKRYNLADSEDEFKAYLAAGNKLKPVSIKNYLSDYRYFLTWLQAHSYSSAVSEIDEEVVQAYKDNLIADMLPRRTINRRLSSLRKFFTFAIKQQWTDKNPAKKVSNVSKNTQKSHQKTNSESISSDKHVELLLSSYKSELNTSSDAAKNAALDDIREFFDIISSQNNHAHIS